ncbi:hypothetical protein ABB37_08469 [Leptomonas pyrrhocoris]|uniref:Uncharacterized protein n=1 Tax=Leptomonas pyrrhocoris TaxID=157538 RepID=A0A0M9FTA7_LEPPY|nr:hypothetical protein ABB37_08469 [Leptomonas pyrrhocoris]KPA75593.1 hypothetical protein ABB37_08469 [Leptomonas pyrrhocoris]|eukprot:XP_015654032.1 hypothetical protein ABB37_08469 [Leptomonas pyrrhocoris]
MPSATKRAYRCSWEIPYDFHPRIRPYPGVTSVVRAYMDGKKPAAATAAEGQEPPPHEGRSDQRKAKHHMKFRHYRLRRSPTAKLEAAVAHALADGDRDAPKEKVPAAPNTNTAPQPPSLPSAPRPSRRRPPRRAAHHPNTKPADTPSKAAAAPRDNVATPSGEDRSDRPQPPAEAPAETAARRRPVALPSHFTPFRREAPAEVSSAPSSVVPVAQAPIAPSPLRPSPPTHTSNRCRTKPRYTLPPSYASQLRSFAAQPVPTVAVRDLSASPLPSSREIRVSPRRVRHASRYGFVQELLQCIRAQGNNRGDVLPHAVLDNYLDTRDAHSFDAAAHNYSTVLPDALEESVAARAAALQATEQRMWARFVVHVAPLAVAHAEAVGAGGVSVIDSGHVSDPIYVSREPDILAAYPSHMNEEEEGGDAYSSEGDDEDDDLGEEMAVVVQPFMDEVPATQEDVRLSERHRCWPKGREWDRQTAIRAAVGATAQEALLDLGVDPRYRRPGDFLLQRNRAR